MAMESTNQQIVDATIEDAIYCHQCRHRRSDAVGTCVTKEGTKTCGLKFCPKCLLSRYGEIGEEVALNDNWVCPRCRKICNCSKCMKNKGEKPTGMLTATAKKNGCSNVSEFLKKEGSEKYFYRGKVKPVRSYDPLYCVDYSFYVLFDDIGICRKMLLDKGIVLKG
ncbi:cell division cycle-associated 7-like protein [Brassica napus]|uniref:cell division cycle-associated 7-like protein n=1 Tax=Brassica napus TaxID=3708 RepID=UPI00207896F3|nr:cell division cycle-associated 7-like protein [Brassica napus]XP_048598712.1 cell division cycle-associated 7-like protein [Brassica napus]XP_048598713.1 cell division cycle-associated 7-like protein [Brassica napus]